MEQKQYELAAQVLREVQKVILGKREIVTQMFFSSDPAGLPRSGSGLP